MALNGQQPVEQQPAAQKIQIYPTSSTGVSPFWREKYEKDAKKYWDIFYKKHQDRFFKDRHYLDKEWGQYFCVEERKVVLEIGCGAGNTVFPLIATYPNVFIHACDFSPRAVNLVKTHKDFNESRVAAFVCDLTADDVSNHISPSSIDVVMMIFVLSAVSPEKMSLVLQNVKKVLKPTGHVLFRDYATGDLAQERFDCKDQKISENFYVRGDGTRAFYFSNEFLTSMFKANGFDVKELNVCCKQVENRSRELIMNRRWVQAVFSVSEFATPEVKLTAGFSGQVETEPSSKENCSEVPVNDFELDFSEGVAIDMFGIPPSQDNEIVEVDVRGWNFKIKVLSREFQHTCKSTGLMLWESARLMASVLAENPTICAGKRVLELGCGCGGICSMVAVGSANLVVATDGDSSALNLLSQNVNSNLDPHFLTKLITERLEWGNSIHIETIREISEEGFDVIIGTDVTYVAEAILPLFSTAKELISSSKDSESALIFCHVLRRVDEPTIVSTAHQFGFRLADSWTAGVSSKSSQSIVSSWFADRDWDIPSTALNIMYFLLDN
ncbi:uncharacterized protein LOC101211005 isoform X2 [Cucumis sativus]|uniref:uncharacterized protein LOC101211005 isoform X2 n=1 Tax=Cucumis sativus TaxID=3659 RepID=UPI0002B42762|nr:uncharacterized protein LOC101211005 isoform X2 [Cucumis sativus]KAE8649910.1 hypothetical protein Csa_012493 [Cucumis sativus]